VITYTWDLPGIYTVEITATNCEGSAVVTDTLVVDVYQPCTELTGAAIDGLTSLLVGETGLYTVTLTPDDATSPSILWSNGITDTQAAYTWTEPGLYSVTVTASNCSGVVVSASYDVEVIQPIYARWMPLIFRPETR
jgi:PKD repeat protein